MKSLSYSNSYLLDSNFNPHYYYHLFNSSIPTIIIVIPIIIIVITYSISIIINVIPIIIIVNFHFQLLNFKHHSRYSNHHYRYHLFTARGGRAGTKKNQTSRDESWVG